MRSDAALKTFVTFRLAGDSLAPDRVTEFFKVRPKQSRVKGETYSTGRSSVIAKTGVWLISSDDFITNDRLNDHIGLILYLLGRGVSLERPGELLGRTSQDEVFRLSSLFLKLRGLLEADSLTSTMTFFWHGQPGSAYPVVAPALLDFLDSVPIAAELDFDRDEELRPPKRLKVA